MAKTIRCKVGGCDLDKCGVCRRCGSEAQAQHQWQEAERHRPCFALKICELCKTEKETPDHDWETVEGAMPGTTNLKCKRCGLSI
jgi:hypothetical protein